MTFEEYDPKSTLVVPKHKVQRARYPFIDVHNHQWDMPEQDLGATAERMDSLNMAVMVNLSGRSGETLRQSVQNVQQNAPGRFIIFANVDFDGIDDPGWTENAVAKILGGRRNIMFIFAFWKRMTNILIITVSAMLFGKCTDSICLMKC